MKYLVCLSFAFAFACNERSDQTTSYVATKGNSVYWAVTPKMDSTALNLLSQTLLEHNIFFRPVVERDQNGQLTKLFGNIIVFDKTRTELTDTLLSNHLILPKERQRWLASQSISVGHTKATLCLPPLGFWYDSTSGLHSDVVSENFPVALRDQVEKDFPSSAAAKLTEQNAQKIKDFKTAMQKGKPAFAFTLPDSSGKLVRLSDYKGKVVYLDFWAHWCEPCIDEMKRLKSLKSRLDRHSDLVLLYVSVDEPSDKDKWLAALKRHHFLGTHLLTTDGYRGSIARSYGLNSLPTKFIIDRHGRFYATNLAYPTEGEKLIPLLEKALSEPY